MKVLNLLFILGILSVSTGCWGKKDEQKDESVVEKAEDKAEEDSDEE